MREQQMMSPTMVSPAPGFTARVMAELAVRERARARRRALMGVGVLVAAPLALMMFVSLSLGSLAALLVANPDVFVTVLLAFAQTADVISTFVGAGWTVIMVLGGEATFVQVVAFALAVVGMTFLWVRVVSGSYQRPIGRTLWEAR
jgi:hypothetical protein